MIKYFSTITFAFILLLVFLLYQCDIGEFAYKELDETTWGIIFIFYFLMLLFNFTFESLYDKAVANTACFDYNSDRVVIAIKLFFLFGFLAVAFKVYLINTQISIFEYSSIRLMYLNGDIHIPAYLEILKYTLYLSMVMSLYFYGLHNMINLRKYLWFSFFMIVLDDLSVGGRGQIAYSFCLMFLSITLFRLFNRKRIISYGMLLLLIIVFIIFMLISFSREESTISRVIDQLITYFTGTFAATNIHISQITSLNLDYSFGYYLFGGVVRNLINSNLPADYGYVDIYISYPAGFNSFTGFAYLFNDFGPYSLFFAFLIPALMAYFSGLFFMKGSFISYVCCIQIWSMQLLLFRDISSKWTVWWVIVIGSYIITYYIGCRRHENSDKQ